MKRVEAKILENEPEDPTFVISVVTSSKTGAYHRNKPKRYDG